MMITTTTETSMQLSDAIECGIATIGWNARPEGWRVAWFNGLMAYVDPDAPLIEGEGPEFEDDQL